MIARNHQPKKELSRLVNLRVFDKDYGPLQVRKRVVAISKAFNIQGKHAVCNLPLSCIAVATVSASILPSIPRLESDMAQCHIQPVSEVAAVSEVADLHGVFVCAESYRCPQFSSIIPETQPIVVAGDWWWIWNLKSPRRMKSRRSNRAWTMEAVQRFRCCRETASFGESFRRVCGSMSSSP
jgi:hypothetical protein